MALDRRPYPKDSLVLSPVDDEIVRHVFQEFRVDGRPVDRSRLVHDLRKHGDFRGRLDNSPLNMFLQRGGQNGFVPSVRALLRVDGGDTDLEALDAYVRLLHGYRDERGPAPPPLDGAQIRRVLKLDDDVSWRRFCEYARELSSIGNIVRADAESGLLEVNASEEALYAADLPAWFRARWSFHRGELVFPPEAPPVATGEAPRSSVRALTVRRFRSLRDIRVERLGPLNVLVGPNNAGKSNVLDALRFLALCAQANYEVAARAMGGIDSFTFRGEHDPVEFELDQDVAGEDRGADLVRYELAVQSTRPIPTTRSLAGMFPRGPVLRERLVRRDDDVMLMQRQDTGEGKYLDEIKGAVEPLNIDASELAFFSLRDERRNATVVRARNALARAWFLELDPEALRRTPPRTQEPRLPMPSLNRDGDNLAEVLASADSKVREAVERDFRELVPEGEALSFSRVVDEGRELLFLRERGFKEPFGQGEMSAGLVRMLAFATLLHVPNLPSIVAIEEPENGVNPGILKPLAKLFRRLSERCQVFLTTHSPYFVDGFKPDELLLVSKSDGATSIQRVGAMADIESVLERLTLGEAWYAGRLEI